MAGGSPYSGGSSGGSPYGGGSSGRRAKKKKGSRFGVFGDIVGKPFGLVGNLAGDVKDAVVGIPFGIMQLAKDPKNAGIGIAKATWQTYEPLSRGDFKEFGQGLYDHPLAPLLDIATVFTAGAGGVARGAGALSKAGVTSSRVERVAGLRKARRIELPDPAGLGREGLAHYTFSGKPGRRVIQEALADHLPPWYTKARFEHRFGSEMAHREFAKRQSIKATREQHAARTTPEALEAANQQMLAIVKGGEVLSNPITAPGVRMELAVQHYLNLHRNAPKRAGLGDELPPNFAYVLDARGLDRTAGKKLRRAQRLEAKWDKQRVANMELAHALPKIEKELEHANVELKRMHREGWTVATRAKTEGPKGLRDNEFAAVTEQQKLVKRLEEQLGKAHVAKGLHNKAVGEIGAINRSRVDLEQRSFREFFKPASESPEAFESFIEKMGRRVLVSNNSRRPRKITEADMARGAVGADGKLKIVPRHNATMLARESVHSTRFMRWLYQNPTIGWKVVLLSYTPRIVTNNVVGNWTIYAGRQGGHHSALGFYDALRLTHGDNMAKSSLMSALGSRNWLQNNFRDVLGNSFLTTLSKEAGIAPGIARSGFYGLVHKLADEPVKAATIAAFMRGAPEVRALMKSKGLSFDRAAHRALRTNRDLRARAAEHALTVAGDYVTLRPWERRVRDLVPFYLWDRHILKTSGNMVLDTPGRVAVAQRVSGLGVEEAESFLGELPEFLKGAIPLGKEGGRADVLLTHSLNPFATVGELAGTADALISGSGPRIGAASLGQVNPFITSGIENVMGQSLLTGAPKERIAGGIIPSVFADVALKLPQPVLASRFAPQELQEALYGAPAKDPLYARDKRSPISSIFGVPLRDVNLALAARMAAEEEDKTLGRRRKRRKKKPWYA